MSEAEKLVKELEGLRSTAIKVSNYVHATYQSQELWDLTGDLVNKFDAILTRAKATPPAADWNTERVARWIVATYTGEDLVKAIVRVATPPAMKGEPAAVLAQRMNMMAHHAEIRSTGVAPKLVLEWALELAALAAAPLEKDAALDKPFDGE